MSINITFAISARLIQRSQQNDRTHLCTQFALLLLSQNPMYKISPLMMSQIASKCDSDNTFFNDGTNLYSNTQSISISYNHVLKHVNHKN